LTKVVTCCVIFDLLDKYQIDPF
jgi:D-alanyl-D-alanine carboxypeptidase